jgi:hypothetical protein
LIELVAEVGGAWKGLSGIFGILTFLFVRYEFLVLFANRMYVWSPYNLEEKEDAKEVSLKTEPLFHFYSCLTLLGCKICYKSPRKKTFEAALKKVEYDLQNNLNIMTLLRKQRMYGYVIDFLTKKKVVRSFTELASSRPIRYIKLDKNRFQWDRLDALSTMDKLRLHFHKKALLVDEKEEK